MEDGVARRWGERHERIDSQANIRSPILVDDMRNVRFEAFRIGSSTGRDETTC
jgi:hypothetical protein